MKKRITFALLGLTVMSATATCPSWPTEDRFTFSTDGAEVTDQRTGLVWARCSVGQTWSGSACGGSADTFTHEAAMQHAATQATWRLPNRRELLNLADRGCRVPAIDSVAFPNTPSEWFFWSSSAVAGNSGFAWVVYFGYGGVLNYPRGGNYHVRLVRVSQ